MLDDIKSCLAEFGLSPKEIDVYLTMLEFGSASVQDIAKKAGVNRSTTYVMIEGLKRRGMASTFDKGKKTLFSAETPQRLRAFLADDLSELQARQHRLEMTLPRLLAIFHAMEDKPRVRYFEGEDALHLARQEMVEAKEPIWELNAVDEPTVQIAKTGSAKRIELSKKVSDARMIFSVKPGVRPAYFDRRGFEVREIDYQRCPFSGALVVVGRKLFIFTTKSIGMGVIVESGEIADIVRAMYEAAWSCARPWIPPEGWETHN